MRCKISVVLSVFLALCLLSSLSSCKKEEETTTKSYLSGTLSVGNPPPYCKGNDSIKFVLSGVYYPSTDTDTTRTIGIYYTLTDIQTTNDTVFNALTNPYKEGCSFSVCMKDSVGLYTATITAYPSASDYYYATSESVEISVVDDYESIPEISPYVVTSDPEDLYTDPRDGRVYALVNAGGNVWMNRNLAYMGTADKHLGTPYGGYGCMAYIFGVYYTQSEALQACPEGWTLPSEADWDALGGIAGDLMVDGYFNSETKLWEYWPKVKITNKYGFGLISSGYCNPESLKFSGELEYGALWTADTELVGGMQYGVYKYVYVEDSDVKRGLMAPEDIAMPVRCIKRK